MDKEDYFKQFENDEKKMDEAFKVALDTRKFEIELYWKRATYFWAFIAATITGYFVLLNSRNIDSFRGFTILISFLGLFFSLGWYYVNRGSKLWQENWEFHVGMLEKRFQGPLFDLIQFSDNKIYNLNKGYPFSVSKVNQLLSLIMVIFWFCVFLYSTLFAFNKLVYIDTINKDISLMYPLTIIIVTIILIVIFTHLAKSFLVADIKRVKNESNPLFIRK